MKIKNQGNDKSLKRKKLGKKEEKIEEGEKLSTKVEKVLKMKKNAPKPKKSQKEYLDNLKKKDPEFYRALMSSKDVMEAVSSDEDDDDDDEFSESGGDFKDETMMNLMEDDDDGGEEEEIGEDEDETEDEDDKQIKKKVKKEDGNNIVTKEKLSRWKEELQIPKTRVPALKNLFQAFRAALESIQGSENFEKISTMVVEGPQSFNDIVRVCLREVSPTIQEIFEGHSNISTAKKWPKLRFALSKYLKDLILLTQSITEPSVIVVILKKGILPLLPFYLKFKFASWDLFRHLGTLWCTSEESVRVLAFIGIFRLLKAFDTDAVKDKSLRLLYMKYVKNCRFTSPFTLPLINFMRVCLVELYSLDHAMAYRHCFIYVRQLAFHLRNALISRKPDHVQNVYNWQYIHCLQLWCELLGKTHPSPVLKPLIYPLTQIANGTIQLSKTNRHIPLVFHVSNMLTDLSHRTSTFIPILPYLLEILSCPRLKKKALKDSGKPLDWDCIIKIATSQFDEEAFTYGVIDQLYNSFYKYLSTECHTIGFPELVFPAVIQLKSFLKRCSVTVFTRKMNQLLDKIEENSKYITDRRRGVTFTIADTRAVHDWEIACRQSEPPILKFYEHFKTMKKDTKDLTRGFSMADIKANKENNAEEDRFALENIRKRQREGDDDGEEEEQQKEEEKRKRKEKKKLKKQKEAEEISTSAVKEEVKEEIENGDVVEEMCLSDIDDSDDGDLAVEDEEEESEVNDGDESDEDDIFEDSDEEDFEE